MLFTFVLFVFFVVTDWSNAPLVPDVTDEPVVVTQRPARVERVWGVWRDDDPYNPDFVPVGSFDDAVRTATFWGYSSDNVVLAR